MAIWHAIDEMEIDHSIGGSVWCVTWIWNSYVRFITWELKRKRSGCRARTGVYALAAKPALYDGTVR
jgi:hypothetical protein